MLSERQALRLLPATLAAALDLPESEVRILDTPPPLDLLVEAAGRRWAVEYKGRSDTATTLAGLRALRDAPPDTHALLVVPFMGTTGAALCGEEGVSWLDLSGNARLRAPGLKVILKGFENRFSKPGRPSNAFAPKSARVTRALLEAAPTPLSQSELAERAGLGSGFVSRIVRRLEEDALVTRTPDGRVQVRDPDVLLDAWAERYTLPGQQLWKGHVSARSSDALLRSLHATFSDADLPYAFTGLPSAWLRQGFAQFRLVTAYVAEPPSEKLLQALRFRPGARGANLWLLLPDDEALIERGERVQDLPCVGVLRTYLDLLQLPERAEEAAQHLRAELLRWGTP
ncbi:MAG: MarR family transcriptional regulator [Alphaproteobacteria bacterium]|nr:MarR family transcriptional regulator [Alphaproteobacteria bacterium]MCB9791532.1 MarR family transcriptional regulator [Alphaproteobacteria bacterium]